MSDELQDTEEVTISEIEKLGDRLFEDKTLQSVILRRSYTILNFNSKVDARRRVTK